MACWALSVDAIKSRGVSDMVHIRDKQKEQELAQKVHAKAIELLADEKDFHKELSRQDLSEAEFNDRKFPFSSDLDMKVEVYIAHQRTDTARISLHFKKWTRGEDGSSYFAEDELILAIGADGRIIESNSDYGPWYGYDSEGDSDMYLPSPPQPPIDEEGELFERIGWLKETESILSKIE